MLNNEEVRGQGCSISAEDISAYIDGELDGESAALVREHLEKCPECASLYNAFADISENIDIEENEEIEYPAELHSSIMARVNAEKKTVPFAARVRRWGMIFGAGAAAVICLAVLGGPIFRGQLDLSGAAQMDQVAEEVEMASDLSKSMNYKAEVANGSSNIYYGLADEMEAPMDNSIECEDEEKATFDACEDEETTTIVACDDMVEDITTDEIAKFLLLYPRDRNVLP